MGLEEDVVIDLDSPGGVVGLRIGMAIEAAEQSLREIPGFVPPAPGEVRNRGFAHYESELSIAIDVDSL